MMPVAAIASRDVRSMFRGAFGVGLAAGFALLSGALLVLDLRADQARLDGWFGPLFVLLGVLAPLLTMRTFAEEERSGSLELVLTSPLRLWQVIAGKLLGVVAVLVVLMASTLACPLLVASMGELDAGPVVTGYLGFFLVGISFAAVGVAISAATGSQLVAGVAAAALLLGLWFAGLVSSGLTGRWRVVLDYLSPSNHVVGFLRGTVALTDVVYFVSLLGIGVVTTAIMVRERR